MNRGIIFGLVLNCLLISPLTQAVSWDYKGATGPKHWSTLSPNYQMCVKGMRQAPINIPTRVVTATTANIRINYHLDHEELMEFRPFQQADNVQPTWLIEQNHHTVQLQIKNPGPTEILQWHNKDYQLLQFHFHIPAENHLNGQPFPMEVHFVNQAKDRSLVVMAVFFKLGQANPAIEKILDQVPRSKKDVQVFSHSGLPFIAKSLLPVVDGYYSFAGSLTTPPCSEPVHWFVMKQPVELSAQQWKKFKSILGSTNARSIQATNSRVIVYHSDADVLSI
jgi:carbonic anhydrase